MIIPVFLRYHYVLFRYHSVVLLFQISLFTFYIVIQCGSVIGAVVVVVQLFSLWIHGFMPCGCCCADIALSSLLRVSDGGEVRVESGVGQTWQTSQQQLWLRHWELPPGAGLDREVSLRRQRHSGEGPTVTAKKLLSNILCDNMLSEFFISS